MTPGSGTRKSGIERLDQSRIAERLGQALHRALLEHEWTEGFLCLRGDEDDWNLMSADPQLPLPLGAGRARHGNIEDQTARLIDVIGCQELFGRREHLSRVAQLLQQVWQRLAYGLVVVDDRHERTIYHRAFPHDAASPSVRM